MKVKYFLINDIMNTPRDGLTRPFDPDDAWLALLPHRVLSPTLEGTHRLPRGYEGGVVPGRREPNPGRQTLSGTECVIGGRGVGLGV